MKDVCTIKFQIFLNIFFQSIKAVFTGVTVPINYDREMEKAIPEKQILEVSLVYYRQNYLTH